MVRAVVGDKTPIVVACSASPSHFMGGSKPLTQKTAPKGVCAQLSGIVESLPEKPVGQLARVGAELAAAGTGRGEECNFIEKCLNRDLGLACHFHEDRQG